MPMLTSTSPIRERFRTTDIPVGGGAIVGVLTGNINESVRPDLLAVQLPVVGTRMNLCLFVRSRDGRYTGATEYQVPQASAGVLRLQFQTKFRAQLADFKSRELGALAELRRGTCEGEDPNAIIAPITWNAQPSSGLVVLVRSDTGVDVDVRTVTGQTIVVCASVSNEERISLLTYNTECRFNWPAGASSVTVRRRSFDNYLPGLTLRLR